jgi:hypothetical protein
MRSPESAIVKTGLSAFATASISATSLDKSPDRPVVALVNTTGGVLD